MKKQNKKKIFKGSIIFILILFVIGIYFMINNNIEIKDSILINDPFISYNSYYNYPDVHFEISCSKYSCEIDSNYLEISDNVLKKVYNLEYDYHCYDLNLTSLQECYNRNFVNKENCIDYTTLLPLKDVSLEEYLRYYPENFIKSIKCESINK